MGNKRIKSHQLGVHLRSVRRAITSQELADYLGVSTRTISSWIASGKLEFSGDLEHDIGLLLSLRATSTGH
jgi:DNA-directed RNA polymerase specialized sigma24 family protein